MKRITRFVYPSILTVATALVALLVLGNAGPSCAASCEPGMAPAAKASKIDRTEARIKELHVKLQITPAQEELWNKVIEAMRDNAKAMESLIGGRSDKAGAMTAVEDLKSYSEIAEAHADGIKKFMAAFEPLYAAMSDEQKKNADAVFAHHGRHHGHHAHAKMTEKTPEKAAPGKSE